MNVDFCYSAATETHGMCITSPADHDDDSHRDGFGNTWTEELPDFIALYDTFWTTRRAYWTARREGYNLALIDQLDREYIAAYHAVKTAAAQLSLT